MIRFLDLARLHGSIRSDLDAAVSEVIKNSGFVGAKACARFEEAFGEMHRGRPAAGCGSGTDALALALRALGVGHGDEVVVPSMTFVATAEAVVHTGATPVIADVDPTTLLLSPDTVAAVRTERTRAVIPVHLYGHLVPYDHLESWRDDGLMVIEDAAQAHLGTWQERTVGEVGHATCFSFYPGKNLGALGDGGLVLAPDPALIDEIKRLRDHGRLSKYEHDIIGWCSRLDGLQAAFLSAKLRHLPGWTEARQRHAAHYRDRLGPHLIPWDDGAVHHLLVVRVTDDRRDAVAAALADRGVETGIHYPIPLSGQPSLQAWSRPCPAADLAADEVLSLPMDPLMTPNEVDAVCDAFEVIVGA